MPAYVIAQIEIDDPETYQQYLAGFMPIFNRYEGELLVTSSAATDVLEGVWEFPHTVVMRFPSKEQARAWYADPDYIELAKIRHRTARANLVVVDGIA